MAWLQTVNYVDLDGQLRLQRPALEAMLVWVDFAFMPAVNADAPQIQLLRESQSVIRDQEAPF